MSFNQSISNSKIVPYIYKLKRGDSLIIHHDNNNIYLVVEGILILHKKFTNGEKFSTCIAYEGKLIQPFIPISTSCNYFYELESISMTYILSISGKDNSSLHTISKFPLKYNLVENYHLLDILIHRNIKQRIIQFFLILCELIGKNHHKYILIDIRLSYDTIATVTGSHKNTISKLINQLEKEELIQHNKHQVLIYNLNLLSNYNQR
uniref:Global nitrogen transcriptional regulator n=1 Tax=Liagoropsis maxima TaxID=1653392 RepID=A0A1G4NW21_9FLOR|nr:Global nitrogen transcriptional regulator [Liagoropsis maxima]SCW22868.1 Global nitrogen transcriptional regulator [Liagoropsis maxima]